ncbi:hypothetical protein [Candidatus Vidania fulgoroideorum]
MKYKFLKKNKNYCKIKVYKLKKGFVGEISSMFRRMILVTAKSYKIEYVIFKGIKHEYTFIDGVQEDVMEIILNFRKVLIKAKLFKKIYIKINKKGPGCFLAREIELPKILNIINKNLIIFRINKNSRIKFLLKIKKISLDSNIKKNKSLKRKIYVNNFISPVEKVSVNYNKLNNSDKFIIKLYTNDTLNSKDLFLKSLKRIRKIFK